MIGLWDSQKLLFCAERFFPRIACEYIRHRPCPRPRRLCSRDMIADKLIFVARTGDPDLGPAPIRAVRIVRFSCYLNFQTSCSIFSLQLQTNLNVTPNRD